MDICCATLMTTSTDLLHDDHIIRSRLWKRYVGRSPLKHGEVTIKESPDPGPGTWFLFFVVLFDFFGFFCSFFRFVVELKIIVFKIFKFLF